MERAMETRTTWADELTEAVAKENQRSFQEEVDVAPGRGIGGALELIEDFGRAKKMQRRENGGQNVRGVQLVEDQDDLSSVLNKPIGRYHSRDKEFDDGEQIPLVSSKCDTPPKLFGFRSDSTFFIRDTESELQKRIGKETFRQEDVLDVLFFFRWITRFSHRRPPEFDVATPWQQHSQQPPPSAAIVDLCHSCECLLEEQPRQPMRSTSSEG